MWTSARRVSFVLGLTLIVFVAAALRLRAARTLVKPRLLSLTRGSTAVEVGNDLTVRVVEATQESALIVFGDSEEPSELKLVPGEQVLVSGYRVGLVRLYQGTVFLSVRSVGPSPVERLLRVRPKKLLAGRRGTRAPSTAVAQRAKRATPLSLPRITPTQRMFLLSMVHVLAKGINRWKLTVRFKGVQVDGTQGVVFPGAWVCHTLCGGDLYGLLGRRKPLDPVLQRQYRVACSVFADALTAYADGYTAFLTYPAGARCRGAIVPSANLPHPLDAGSSPATGQLKPGALLMHYVARLGTEEPTPISRETFLHLARGFVATWRHFVTHNRIQGIKARGGTAPKFPDRPAPIVGARANGGGVVGRPFSRRYFTAVLGLR